MDNQYENSGPEIVIKYVPENDTELVNKCHKHITNIAKNKLDIFNCDMGKKIYKIIREFRTEKKSYIDDLNDTYNLLLSEYNICLTDGKPTMEITIPGKYYYRTVPSTYSWKEHNRAKADAIDFFIHEMEQNGLKQLKCEISNYEYDLDDVAYYGGKELVLQFELNRKN
ncbi:MAG: hypothetical protein Satyrvirus31_4 [Satyrvirus sp.]|uniref:Uncharacterized protein n=1 Tax=Satyrvirus sp. TaxID=2487771 RepID=A0A3G5AES7_9VIRU|nr:MAG: hypothetical protein Satyrvirus31_4 [Satyrvirus sp.]